jgi:hypothetical protein
MSKLVRFLTVCVVCMVPQAARAQKAETFTSSDVLYQRCVGTEEEKIFCTAYVLGVIDTLAVYKVMLGQGVVCLPPNVSAGELAAIVTKYLGNHRKEEPGGSGAVSVALNKVYPCPAQRQHGRRRAKR